MDTKKLRQKILDLAIRGKLVPQDPNDEPASVLLARIRAEKERLIAEGKIKRPKKAKASSDASHYENFEPPFEIPDSWQWVRLEDIAYVASGSTPSKECFKDSGVPYLKMYNLRNQAIDFQFKPQYITKEIHDGKLAKSRSYTGDLIMNIVGPPLGKLAIIPEEIKECNFNQAAVVIRPYCETKLINRYLFYYLGQMGEIDSITTKGTAGQDNISLTQSQNMRIALPPHSEIKRLVDVLDNYFRIIKTIEEEGRSIKSLLNDAKSKILELAMQGKLVPQDPADEPAADMLRRVNPKAEIITDNPHYPQLPDNWVKVRLKDLAVLLSGRDLPSEECSNNRNEVPYLIGASNIDNGLFNIVRWTSKPQVLSELNDILISCKGTIGELVINNYGLMHIARQFMAIRCSKCINPVYLYYAIAERMNEIRKKANGIIPGISRPVLLDLIICVPSLAEQKRVVLEIQRYYSAITLIQTALNL